MRVLGYCRGYGKSMGSFMMTFDDYSDLDDTLASELDILLDEEDIEFLDDDDLDDLDEEFRGEVE